MSEREGVVTYLKNVMNKVIDPNLKYDVYKCLETLEGKENQEYKDLKEVFEEVLAEKETLFIEKCELLLELQYLKDGTNMEFTEHKLHDDCKDKKDASNWIWNTYN